MDAFFALFAVLLVVPDDEDVEADVPVNVDTGGSGNNSYCTIA
jgi:hypothetical protein